MAKNQIELKKINEFKKNSKVKEVIEKAWVRYSKFLKLYPFRKHPEYIDSLTPEKVYNPGKGKEYFVTWIEHKLKALGHIAIGSASVWVNTKNNIDKFKELLKMAVDDSISISEKIDAHWEDIKGLGGDKHIVKKILSLYYPEDIIPIFKTEDLEHFVEILGLEYRQKAYKRYGRDYDILSIGQKFELLQNLLLEFKNKNQALQNWDNLSFGWFLYTYFPPSKIIEIGKPKLRPISRYGLVAEPLSEQEVIFLFSKFHVELGFPIIIKIGTTFPDAEVLNEKRESKKIEFERLTSDFISHNHDPKACDYIICWENDLDIEQIKRKGLPEIISLKERLEK